MLCLVDVDGNVFWASTRQTIASIQWTFSRRLKVCAVPISSSLLLSRPSRKINTLGCLRRETEACEYEILAVLSETCGKARPYQKASQTFAYNGTSQILNAQILRDGARFETQAKGDLRSRCRTWENSTRVVHCRRLAAIRSGRKQTTVSNDPTIPNNSILCGQSIHGTPAHPNPFFLFVNGATAGTIPVLRRDLRYGAGTCMHKPRRTIGRAGGLGRDACEAQKAIVAIGGREQKERSG